MARRVSASPSHVRRRPSPGQGRLLAALGAVGLAGAALAQTPEPYGGLDVFAGVLARVEQSYVRPVEPRALVYAALGGLVGALDPHSAWYPPEVAARIREAEAGVVVGAGLEGRPEGCGWRVTGVLPGGPGARAGIRAGECVEAVDGAALAGLAAPVVADRLDRPEGHTLALRLLGPAGDRREVFLVTGRLVVPVVVAERVAPGVAWIRVRGFRPGMAAELAAALVGQERVLVDLRGNPGGELEEAVRAVDLVLGAGPAVRTEGRGPGATASWTTRDDPADWAGPMVVLVDEHTASAAEIYAGILQERGRARLVGARTWGKGTMQSVWAWADGSALRLTVATWRLPSGRALTEGEGLEPDRRAGSVRAGGDHDRLRTRLATAPGLRATDRAELLALVDRLHPPPLPTAELPFPERLRVDPALSAAWEELRALRP